ncbi:glycosyltransferase 61 family protein [Butyrivibrio sp. MC2021]|uniref:glycosyltransferase 61 family protein n=1 Tax=Butyrivibrio sp. MC2021 TaxID=1408306 RepID=UPI000479B89E|nr:glycosyltransferase 61 family protein [Butyrivibrio sp. MC2021]
MFEHYLPKEMLPEYLELESIDYKRDDSLSVLEIEKGIILSPRKDETGSGLSKATFGLGGVVDSEGRFVEASVMDTAKLIRRSKLCKKRFGGFYEVDPAAVAAVDEEVIYMGFFWEQYGHFLVDIIGRLWYALDNDLKIACVISGKKIGGNYLKLLNLMGIDEDRIIYVTEPTSFKKVYVPETSFYPGKYYTSEYKGMIDRIITSAAKECEGLETYDKVYFSRSSFPSAEVGEKSIEKLMEKNGFHILHPEKLSTAQQVYYVNNCRHLASIEGTIAHNCVFMNAEARQTIFIRGDLPNVFQFQLNSLKGVPADMVFCENKKRNDKSRKKLGKKSPVLVGMTDYIREYCQKEGLIPPAAAEKARDILSLAEYNLKVLKAGIRK